MRSPTWRGSPTTLGFRMQRWSPSTRLRTTPRRARPSWRLSTTRSGADRGRRDGRKGCRRCRGGAALSLWALVGWRSRCCSSCSRPRSFALARRRATLAGVRDATRLRRRRAPRSNRPVELTASVQRRGVSGRRRRPRRIPYAARRRPAATDGSRARSPSRGRVLWGMQRRLPYPLPRGQPLRPQLQCPLPRGQPLCSRLPRPLPRGRPLRPRLPRLLPPDQPSQRRGPWLPPRRHLPRRYRLRPLLRPSRRAPRRLQLRHPRRPGPLSSNRWLYTIAWRTST